MRGFLSNLDRKSVYAVWVIAGLFCILFWFVLYKGVMFVISYAVESTVQTQLTILNTKSYEFDRKIIILEAEQEEIKLQQMTAESRIKALTAEQSWVREQEPSRGVSVRHSQMMEITAYTCHVSECGKLPGEKGYCTTASGLKLLTEHNKRIVAADPRVFKAGTKLMIEGIGLVIVSDTGSAIKGNRLDLFWDETDRAGAMKWGRQLRKVTVMQ